jgi:hypothetical protein
MYHNILMGTNSNQAAASLIYTNFANGSEMSMGNWYSYDHDLFFIDWFIDNQSAYDVLLAFQLWNENNTSVATTGAVLTNTLSQSNGTLNLASSSLINGYKIAVASVQFLPPGPFPPNTWSITLSANAFDTDGVGQATNRNPQGLPSYVHVGGITPAAYGAQLAVDDAGGTIATNKRTTIEILIV